MKFKLFLLSVCMGTTVACYAQQASQSLTLDQAKAALTSGKTVTAKWVFPSREQMKKEMKKNKIKPILLDCGPALPKVTFAQLDNAIANKLLPTLVGTAVDFPKHLECHYQGDLGGFEQMKVTTDTHRTIDNPKLVPCPNIPDFAGRPICLSYDSKIESSSDWQRGEMVTHSTFSNDTKNYTVPLQLFQG